MKEVFNTRRIAALALMAALSTGLHLIESLFPQFLPIPGFRLGLANLITLFVLYYYGGLSYIFVSALKVVLVGLIATGFGINFLMSLSGTVLAIIISLFLKYVIKPSCYGVSIVASLFHTIGQLLCYGLFFNTMYIFSYIIVLGPLSIISGYLMALFVGFLIKKIPNSFKNEEKIRR